MLILNVSGQGVVRWGCGAPVFDPTPYHPAKDIKMWWFLLAILYKTKISNGNIRQLHHLTLKTLNLFCLQMYKTFTNVV